MQIIDLTGVLENKMWDYGEPFVPYTMKRLTSMENDGYLASVITLTSHTGTHLDCPRHFGEERKSIPEMDLNKFYGNARLVDISDSCVKGMPVNPELLQHSEAQNIKPGEICVLRTGWEKMWNTAEYVEHYPYLTPEAAEYLAEKKIKLLAADIPIVGNPHDTLTDMVLCEKEIPSVYSLVNTEKLPKQFLFSAFPLKIKDGDGSPVRAVAIIE